MDVSSPPLIRSSRGLEGRFSSTVCVVTVAPVAGCFCRQRDIREIGKRSAVCYLSGSCSFTERSRIPLAASWSLAWMDSSRSHAKYRSLQTTTWSN